MSGRRVGERGERLGAAFLERAGWRILDRNFRVGHGEIDLVARCGEVVAFVEVKTRSGDGFGHPLESITYRKRVEIGRVAASWIMRFGTPGSVYRFDALAVSVRRGRPPRVEHLADAWRMDEAGSG